MNLEGCLYAHIPLGVPRMNNVFLPLNHSMQSIGNVIPYDYNGPVVTPFTHTLRLRTAYCASSLSELFTNMQNHLVHHLIGTKLHCALPKTDCMNLGTPHCNIYSLGGSQRTYKSWFTMEFCTDIHFGGAQCRFVRIRWCTWWFCVFIMDYRLDGAQCVVVSLDVCVNNQCLITTCQTITISVFHTCIRTLL